MNAPIHSDRFKQAARRRNWTWVKTNWGVYVMLLPAILCTLVFVYLPMPGIIVAFQKYNPFLPLLRSPFVGLDNIRRIFVIPGVSGSIGNTLYLSVLSLVTGFPAPIILAFLLNEIGTSWFKRTVQTISYMPYFLSWISVVAIAMNLYSVYGSINDLRLMLLGPDTKRLLFMSFQSFFVPNILILSVWKNVGWSSILYLATITSIDPQLYEAAVMDGASKIRQVWHITLPGILPTTMIMLIFALGGLFNSNFELVYGLQNPYIDFEVISTVVYKMGIGKGDYGLATAVGFLQSLMALALTFGANWISKKATGLGIW